MCDLRVCGSVGEAGAGAQVKGGEGRMTCGIDEAGEHPQDPTAGYCGELGCDNLVILLPRSPALASCGITGRICPVISACGYEWKQP
jgi:hypothetical protein